MIINLSKQIPNLYDDVFVLRSNELYVALPTEKLCMFRRDIDSPIVQFKSLPSDATPSIYANGKLVIWCDLDVDK